MQAIPTRVNMVCVQMHLMDVALIFWLITTYARVIEDIWDLNVTVGDIDIFGYNIIIIFIYSSLCLEFEIVESIGFLFKVTAELKETLPKLT